MIVSENQTLKLIGLAILLGFAGFAVSVFRPEYVGRSIVLVLGTVPFASFPVLGIQLQWVLALIIVYWFIAAIGIARKHLTAHAWRPALVSVYGLLLLSFISYLTTRGQFGAADDSEFLKWALSTSLVLVLARQSADEIRRLARIFVISTSGAAVYAILSIMPGGSFLLNLLGSVGYQRGPDDNQAYFLQNGDIVSTRLSGTFVDPNIAAMFFFVALLLAFLVLDGRIRIVVSAVLLVALVATLSRGGMLALGTALVLFLIFNRRNIHRRIWVLLFSLAAGALILAVPVTRQRLLTTFGQNDVGSADRLEALDQFWTVMGHGWVWGLGWGRPEFRSAAVSYAVNMVANAPLASVYRGGVVAGAGFLCLLLVCTWAAIKLIRRGTARSVVVAGLIGGFIAAIQTGYSVITIAPMTCLLALVMIVVVRSEAFLAGDNRVQGAPSDVKRRSGIKTERPRLPALVRLTEIG